ncbi:MAG: fluoride efflux transporter CrcB [Solirubrobacteraceae bacterium]
MEREPDIDATIERPASPAPGVDRLELAAIFAGGALGALLRSALAELLHAAPDRWPWASFTVNMAAALALAFAVAYIGEHHPRTLHARAFWATGLCGALSTFSTVIAELVRMQEAGATALACAYAAASVAAGLALVWLGTTLAARLRRGAPLRRAAREGAER